MDNPTQIIVTILSKWGNAPGITLDINDKVIALRHYKKKHIVGHLHVKFTPSGAVE